MRAAISVAATAPARTPATPPQHCDVAAAVETTTRVETQAQLLGRGHVHFVQTVRRRSQGRVLVVVVVQASEEEKEGRQLAQHTKAQVKHSAG